MDLWFHLVGAGTVPLWRVGPLVSSGWKLGLYQDRGLDLWFHLVGDWDCTRIEVWTSGFILLELGLYQDRGFDLWFHLVVILTHTFVQNHVFA